MTATTGARPQGLAGLLRTLTGSDGIGDGTRCESRVQNGSNTGAPITERATLVGLMGLSWQLVQHVDSDNSFIWRLVASDSTIVDSCPEVHEYGDFCTHMGDLLDLQVLHTGMLRDLEDVA